MTSAAGPVPHSKYLGNYTQAPEASPRLDIQVLRGVAIILVLLHHGRAPFIPGGFLGVDIFFVVSGFLMTGIITRGLDTTTFSFRGFYVRRVRRLLPAAYAALIATAVAAPLILDSYEDRDYFAQLLGSFTFSTNFVLWHQSDYFNTGAALKPLLHMWSLAIEEQYYIGLPLLMYISPARWRLPAAILLTLGSGFLCVWCMQRSPTAAFYLIPFRAWELGIGSVTALLVHQGIVAPKQMPVLRLLCAGVLVAVPMLLDEQGHPGIGALLVCVATALLMVPGASSGMLGILRPVGVVGDRSYSLYLVHWPLLAFVNNVYINTPPPWMSLVLLVPCLLWAEMQYRWVERPFRQVRASRTSIAAYVLVPILTTCVVWILIRNVLPDVAPSREYNFGLGRICDSRGDFTNDKQCRTGSSPRTLVWGDSYAMAITPGLAATTPGGIIQATRTVCGPFIGLAPLNGAQPKSWGASCIKFNDSVLHFVAHSPQIDTVVLSSSLSQYIPGAEQHHWRALVRQADTLNTQPQRRELLLSSLLQTVDALHSLGKRVVLVTPPPSAGFDIARCQSRLNEGLVTVNDHANCGFSLGEYREANMPVIDFENQVASRRIVPLLSLDGFLCGSGRCETSIDGVSLYRDSGHLSIPGSTIIGRQVQLGKRARELAL